MIVLVSGGCKNGKSSYAEKLVCESAGENKKYYIATMVPSDDEDKKRIERHRENRKNDNWNTIEVKKSLEGLKNISDNEYILFDSLTAFVLNHIIFLDDGELNLQNDFDVEVIYKNIITELENFALNKKNIVFVADYIYSVSSFHIDNYSYKYMELLSKVCRHIAKVVDKLIDIKYGNPIFYKGEE